jgi:short-subunit dehydrogenase
MLDKNLVSVILITGVTSGIGLALASKLVRINSYRLVLCGRDPTPKLKAAGIIESENVLIRDLDVTNSKQCAFVIDEVLRLWGGVDVLVNNAGIAYRSVIEHASNADFLHQLQVNFIAPMEFIRLVLPEMRQKLQGRIINVSSVGGMMAMPTMGAYSASKFALEGATEALWYEMQAWNIKVSLIQPGFIHSNSFRTVYWSAAAKRAIELGSKDPYSAYYSFMGKFIEKMMGFAFATPESVATKILNTINEKNPPLRVQATLDAILFTYIRRFLPRFIYHKILFFFLSGIKKVCELEDNEEFNKNV